MSQNVFDTLIVMGSITGSSVLIVLGAFFFAKHFFKDEDPDVILEEWDEEYHAE